MKRGCNFNFLSRFKIKFILGIRGSVVYKETVRSGHGIQGRGGEYHD